MKKVLALVAILAASPAVAQDKAAVCEVSRDFVAQAVEARVEGLTEKETKSLIKDGLTENVFMWSPVKRSIWIMLPPNTGLAPAVYGRGRGDVSFQ